MHEIFRIFSFAFSSKLQWQAAKKSRSRAYRRTSHVSRRVVATRLQASDWRIVHAVLLQDCSFPFAAQPNNLFDLRKLAVSISTLGKGLSSSIVLCMGWCGRAQPLAGNDKSELSWLFVIYLAGFLQPRKSTIYNDRHAKKASRLTILKIKTHPQLERFR